MSDFQKTSLQDETLMNEEHEELKTPPASFWQRASNFLFSPHQSITEVGARRQARLVSIIALLVTFTNSIGAFSVIFFVKSPRAGTVLIGLSAASILGFVLTRTRYYQAGSYIIVGSLAIAAFGVGSAVNISNSLYSNLIPALVIASIAFPFRHMAIFVVFINIAIGLLPFFYPEYSGAGSDLSVFIPFSVLTLAAMRFRENVERDRLGEVRQTNRELQTLSNELEERVMKRTTELEQSTDQIQKRAAQFETIAQLARIINSIQDPDSLRQKITQLVSASFGFYQVGIFLLDESRQYAVLIAANSEGGQKMLDRKHRLKVGSEGIVGYVTSTGNPRIALDTGADAVYFDNPELQETRSEMALPLRVGKTIVGALDVQSTIPNAFSEDDVEVLSILADVVSVAIENARLFEESQRVLTEAQTAFSKSTIEAWQKMTKRRKMIGYELAGTTIRSIDKPIKGNGSSTAIPIKLRDRAIGTMNINLPEDKKLDTDETDISKALAERVGIAIENAILLEETQRTAAKEQMIGEITGKIGSSINLRSMLQTAVEELGRNIPGAEIVIELKNDQSKKQDFSSGEIA
jgi:GAF domain-containing protein